MKEEKKLLVDNKVEKEEVVPNKHQTEKSLKDINKKVASNKTEKNENVILKEVEVHKEEEQILLVDKKVEKEEVVANKHQTKQSLKDINKEAGTKENDKSEPTGVTQTIRKSSRLKKTEIIVNKLILDKSDEVTETTTIKRPNTIEITTPCVEEIDQKTMITSPTCKTNTKRTASLEREKFSADSIVHGIEPITVANEEKLNDDKNIPSHSSNACAEDVQVNDETGANKETDEGAEITVQGSDKKLFIMLDNKSVDHKRKRKSTDIKMEDSDNISVCKKSKIEPALSKIDVSQNKRKTQSECSNDSKRLRLDAFLVQQPSSVEITKDTSKTGTISSQNTICHEPAVPNVQHLNILTDQRNTGECEAFDETGNLSLLKTDISKGERVKEITVEAFESFVTSAKINIGSDKSTVFEVKNNVTDTLNLAAIDKTKSDMTTSNVNEDLLKCGDKKSVHTRFSTDSNRLSEASQVCLGNEANESLAIDEVIEKLIQSPSGKTLILDEELHTSKVENQKTLSNTVSSRCNQEIRKSPRKSKRSEKSTSKIIFHVTAEASISGVDLSEIPVGCLKPDSTSTYGEVHKIEEHVFPNPAHVMDSSVATNDKNTLSDSAEQLDLQKNFEREFMNEINNFQNRAEQKGVANAKIETEKDIHTQDLAKSSVSHIESSNSSSSISAQPVSEHQHFDSIIGSVLDYDFDFFGNTETGGSNHLNNASMIDFSFNPAVTSNSTAFHNHQVQYTSINAFDTSTYTPIYQTNSSNDIQVSSVSPKPQQSTYQTIPVTINQRIQEYGSGFARSIMGDAQKCTDHSYADDVIEGKSSVTPNVIASTVEDSLQYHLSDGNNAVFTSAPRNLPYNPIFSESSSECTPPQRVSLETNNIFQSKSDPLPCSESNLMDSMISGGQIADVLENLVIRSSDCNNTDTMDTSNPLASSGVLDEANLDFCLESIIDDPTGGVPVSHLGANFTISDVDEIHEVCTERPGNDQEMPDFFAHEIPEPVSEISIVTQSFIEDEPSAIESDFGPVSAINTVIGSRTSIKKTSMPINSQFVKEGPSKVNVPHEPALETEIVKELTPPSGISMNSKNFEKSGSRSNINNPPAIPISGTRKPDDLKFPYTKAKSPSAPTGAATRAMRLSRDKLSAVGANKKILSAVGTSYGDVTRVRSSTKIRTSPRKPPIPPPRKEAKPSTLKPETTTARRKAEDNYDLISTLTKPNTKPKPESETTARTTRAYTQSHANTSSSTVSSETSKSPMDLLFDKVVKIPTNVLFRKQVTKQKETNKHEVGSETNVNNTQNSRKSTPAPAKVVKSSTIKPQTPRSRRKTEENYDLISTLTKPNNKPKPDSTGTSRAYTQSHANTSSPTISSETSREAMDLFDQLKNESTKSLFRPHDKKKEQINKPKAPSKPHAGKIENDSDNHELSLSGRSSSQNTIESVKSKSEPYHQSSSNSPAIVISEHPLFPDPPANPKAQKSRKTDPYIPEDDDQFAWSRDFLHGLRKCFDRDESSLQLPGTRSVTAEPRFEDV